MPCMTEPGTEEQSGLEEAVRHQVEDRERVPGRAETGGQDHVADLAHRGSGQGLLDVVLGGTDEGTEEQRQHTDQHDGEACTVGEVVDRVRSHDEVDTGGDHRCRVDQR